jgi:uncharacterized membrane protein
VLGDVHGAAHFNDNPDGIVSNLMGLGVGAVIATVYLFAITVKNAVSIHTGRQLSWLKIVGQIFSVLGYVVVAGVSLLIYNIIYSLHDPSTE